MSSAEVHPLTIMHRAMAIPNARRDSVDARSAQLVLRDQKQDGAIYVPAPNPARIILAESCAVGKNAHSAVYASRAVVTTRADDDGWDVLGRVIAMEAPYAVEFAKAGTALPR
jgi:hypothetical protein